MFDRLTDNAMRAFELAREQARGSDQECVDVEHILLGVLCEDCGALFVLRRIHVDVEGLRKDAHSSLSENAGRAVGPFSQGTIRTLELAVEEAGAGRERYIGTEHLLAGLLRVPDSNAGELLARHGVDLARVRQEIRRLPGPEGLVVARSF